MRRLASFVPLVLVAVAVVSACSSDASPDGNGAPSNPNGSIAGNGSGFVNSSGGASGKPTGSSSSGTTFQSYTDTTEETMDFDGSTRRYLLSKPKEYDATRKYPLVLNLHGNPGKPEDEHAILPFDSVSQNDAVIAYPAAADGSDWNFATPDEGNEDMAWIKPLIDDIATKVNIDPNNVLGFGYSGGAYFLSQYACRVGGVLKMVAIVSGGAPELHDGDQKRPDDCVICPAGGVPMLIAHGMNDQSDVPFEGGDYARICWAEQNGCTNSDLSDIAAPCKKYNGCDDGKPLTWCPVPNQDHAAWVGSMQAAWSMFRGL